MSSDKPSPTIDSAASHARPSTQQERQAMLAVAARLDAARRGLDCAALKDTFHPSAICEFKPAGLRIAARDTIAEMFRRSMPRLAASLAERRQLREWTNQNGLLREWSYQRMFPLIGAMADPEVVNTWFADDGFIGEVRISKPRPDGGTAHSSQFAWCEFTGDLISSECNYFDEGDVGYAVHALGEDFFELPGVTVTPTET